MIWAKVMVTFWLASDITESAIKSDHPEIIEKPVATGAWGLKFIAAILILTGLWMSPK